MNTTLVLPVCWFTLKSSTHFELISFYNDWHYTMCFHTYFAFFKCPFDISWDVCMKLHQKNRLIHLPSFFSHFSKKICMFFTYIHSVSYLDLFSPLKWENIHVLHQSIKVDTKIIHFYEKQLFSFFHIFHSKYKQSRFENVWLSTAQYSTGWKNIIQHVCRKKWG